MASHLEQRAATRRFAFATALGRCALEYGPQGIRAVRLPSTGQSTGGPHSAPIRALGRRIARALEGKPTSFAGVKLDLSGVPPLHLDLYRALQSVPWGVTLSYGQLAARAGRPGAARAAGRAMALCRWSILIPCHRVVASQGLGGWGSGGLAMKRRLLDLEANPPRPRSLIR